MATSRIHASEQPLTEVFGNHYVFRIPYYQRPYRWGTEEAEQLLDDLLMFLGDVDDTPIADLEPYFLGSIVLIKNDSPDAEVVDGQQRLTTLTILFAALRETLSDPNMRSGVTSLLCSQANPVAGLSAQYRLTTRPQDADFFRQRIQNPGGFDLPVPNVKLPDSQRRILENALRLRERLKGIPESRRERLAQFMAQRCFLVVVSTPDSLSAFRIFSVLNDRGMDLTHADILKAEVIGAMSPQKEESYARKWEAIEDDLGQDRFKDLFAHIRMIFHPYKLRSTVLDEIRQHINPRERPEWFVDTVLVPYAEVFGDLLRADYASTQLAEDVNRVLTWLGRVDNVDWIPPALLFIVKNKPQPHDLLRFLLDLDRLAYGLMILRANINERIGRYSGLIGFIQSGRHLYSADSPLQLSEQECGKVLRELDGPIYEHTVVRLPILLRLDQALSGGGAKYDYPVVTIEHVLPQNPQPSSLWYTWFPDEKERLETVHRLGNLVLLTRRKNAAASNDEFDVKKTTYFSTKAGGISPFAITTKVLQEAVWTPSVFSRRQAESLQALKILWRL